jgi:NTP pyrophosphatase (non-canonical NTP hydrolase)
MSADKTQMNPWQVCLDPKTLRPTGKTLEELGELVAVLARVIIQGVDEVDPGSGRTNRVRLEDELADVLAQCCRLIETLGLNRGTIMTRVAEKDRQMAEWDSLYPLRYPD